MAIVEILGGSSQIGGNFVKVSDGDTALIFDQGIRFDIMGKYYSRHISPSGIRELREIGALPSQQWYEGAEAVYISHMHLDHLGALSNIPNEIKVKVPSSEIYEYMKKKWGNSGTWLSLIPARYFVEIEGLKPYEVDKNNVMAIPVSHSAYPAYSFIYLGSDEIILYTGDFRIKDLAFDKLHNGPDLLSFLRDNADIRIDTLIIEGTNIGSDRLPLSPPEVMGVTRRLVEDREQVIATTHHLDIENAYSLMSLAGELGLEVAVASELLAKLLEIIGRSRELPAKLAVVEEYVRTPSQFPLTSLSELGERALILVSYSEVVNLVRDMKFEGSLSDNSVALISEPEPQVEEGSDYSVVINWLARFGIEYYRSRASGHYYQYQLREVLDIVKPRKRVMPIHTGRAELFAALLNKLTSAHITQH